MIANKINRIRKWIGFMNELEEIENPPEELVEMTEQLTKDEFLLKHIIYQSNKAYFLFINKTGRFVELECDMF